jgi:hypothetical protein
MSKDNSGYWKKYKRWCKGPWYKKNTKKWTILFLGFFNIVILFGVFHYSTPSENKFSSGGFLSFAIGIIGIFTFTVFLALLNFLSDPKSKDNTAQENEQKDDDKKHLDSGEVRKAIAATFIVVYFAVFALINFEQFGTEYTGLFKQMLDHFTYLVGIIVVFYFGSRSVEKYLEFRKDNNS